MQYFFKFFVVGLMIGFTAAIFLAGCVPSWWDTGINNGQIGGGQDLIIIDLPFESGYKALCTQGPGGDYSHFYNSTRFDVDLDTPNNFDDYIFAPASGVARVHNNPNVSFGRHINIDLGDGTYIVMAHLEEIFVEDGEEVAMGQLLGFEGTTGASSGDHLHIGRHNGDAGKNASQGTSVEGLAFRIDGPNQTITVSNMNCGLTGGTRYVSRLKIPTWHPSGSLIKSPRNPNVYLLEDGTVHLFVNESAFWSRNYSFADLSLVTERELTCYGYGDAFFNQDEIKAVRNGADVWLLFRPADDSSRYRIRLRDAGMIGVLNSWGINIQNTDYLFSDSDLGGVLAHYPVAEGYAKFREGTLVSEEGSSAVFVVADGVAMPIVTWDAFLLLDFFDRYIIKVAPGVVSAVQGTVGNCSMGTSCIDFETIFSCYGYDYYDNKSAPNQDLPDFGDTGDLQDEEADCGGGSSSCEESKELLVSWNTSVFAMPEMIKLSGEFTRENGETLGWENDLVIVCGQSTVVYQRSDAKPGDTFEFFVEYLEDGTFREFCNIEELAPLNGPVSVTYGGVNVNREVVSDPDSDLCNVRFTIL
ncbi:MAG: M23 family metallopeptidase [Patescibacteria group bacterium]